MDARCSFEQEIQELFADRETRRAKQPLNVKAVTAADDIFYARHPELVKNGKRISLDPSNPKHWTLQSEWMDLYLANGGELEGKDPTENQGGLVVRVIDDIGIPVEGATVTVDQIDPKPSGDGGIADFGLVAPGTYSITTDKSDLEPRTTSIWVQAGESSIETIRLTRIRSPNARHKHMAPAVHQGLAPLGSYRR
jgi:hypothetical protein